MSLIKSSSASALGAGVLALLFAAAPARGDSGDDTPSKTGGHACTAALKKAQKLEQEGHLQEATKALVRCARSSCGRYLLQECSTRHAQLESEIPSVVPLFTDETGATVSDVQVALDGEPLVSRLDGRALNVDPGLHEFSFRSSAGAVISTEKIMIVQGQRNRLVTASLRPGGGAPLAGAAGGGPGAAIDTRVTPQIAQAALESHPPAPESSLPESPPSAPAGKRGLGAAPYVLGSVGLLGLGGYAVLTYWGRKDNARLAECSPNCPQASVDHVRQLYTVADVAAGVGVVALAAATWIALSPSGKKEPAHASYVDAQHAPRRYHVDVMPVPSGAVAALAGGF